MFRPAWALVPTAVAFLTVAAIAQAPAAAPAASGAYAGSESCRTCHQPEYDTWRSSLHVQMTKPIADARVVGDFTGAHVDGEGGRRFTMEQRGGKYVISISRHGRPAEAFTVDYTLGAKRFQGYLSKLPDGRIYVLPVFWHNESRRWLDYKAITPVPDDPSHELRQIWNVACVNCHATNLVRNYNPDKDAFATTWTEMGIGCEACHGPGQAHIDDPVHLKIFSMKKVPTREIFDACGYCHGNKNNVFFGFKPGDKYDDYAQPFLISEPIPGNDPQGEFWPDGRPSRFNRPQALTLSGCFRSGQATCTSCHRIHGAQNDHSLKVPVTAPGGGHTRESDRLCTQCHAASADGPRAPSESVAPRSVAPDSVAFDRPPAPIPDINAHTHHDPTSPGSRCIACHMSDVNWRLLTRRLDHTFQPPVPEMTARYGVPNACTSCHEGKTPEWASAQIDTWYGNTKRRQAIVAVADTMYRAGSGDVAVLPDVARLAVDRMNGALIRASAAQFTGQLLARSGDTVVPPALINSLIGAAADSEGMVRIAAVRALALHPDPRIITILTAYLIDPSRVVRVSAAAGLMNAGVTTLDGPEGAALARAQDEWADSLRTFNDDAADQTSLGELDAARGRTESAVRALTTAARLDPSNARPHVSLGVLAARTGQYAEALQQFKTAKSLAPAYPNIDKLIAEAQKRR